MASECWIWAGSKDRHGYGHLYIRGTGPPYGPKQAHRIVYEALVGDIPQGMQLDHLCRVPACVNPEHLEPVTQKTNILRGVGLTAQNAKKTHCPHGHAYSDHAQVMRPPSRKGSVWRRCGKCHSIKEAERRRRITLSQVN